ncbi:hypothetical protein SISNIDRAFT_492607 [Sistotremastrum niveocremeum HHB9708]|uniref:Uncharacterized protein n=1 Tax=Sistotremastrum niveocremeum HHB9708 TaxID=1314777 RepID=A0A164ZYJ3_9AGAM|nr:hypothetical protein SISNIDRAFT_492607 [Sistotremastrum niveocremeum HHB9708]
MSKQTLDLSYHHLAALIYDPLFRVKFAQCDQQALHDWGILEAPTLEEKRRLLEIYDDLFRLLNVKPSTAHKWRLQGCLHSQIVATYQRAGRTFSDVNYAWVRQHPELFHIKTNYSAFQHRLKLDLITRVGMHIGLHLDDEGQEEVANWSGIRQDCFAFYVSVFDNNRPPVELPGIWITFGYCTVSDDRPNILFQEIYPLLIEKCTFEEFVDAYSTSSLITVMDRKGLKKLRAKMPPEFEIVLSESPNRVAAVWALKSFVVHPSDLLDSTLLIPFGFANCTDRAEISRLRHYYGKVFDEWKGSPLELQRAAEQDVIFDFVMALPSVKLSKSERRFLRRVLTTRNQTQYKGKLPFFRENTSV